MRAIPLFCLAGLLEIGGGYLVWLWLRTGRSALWGAIGFLALAAYGVVPVLQDRIHSFARVYAAYGAIFIVLSLLWGWGIDRHDPDARDLVGATLCLVGATIMMWPRLGS